jgi:hypothetical protein
MIAVQQFSLRGLFFATLVVAVFCWAYVALPPPLWVVLLGMLALSATVSAIVYGPGNIRAFAIGCLPTIFWWAVATGGTFYTPDPDGSFRFALVVFTLLSGYTSVCVRRWSLRGVMPAKMEAQPGEEDARAETPCPAEPAGPAAELARGEKSVEDDIFVFIEGNKRYWRCPACHDLFLSLQVQPTCPRCGSRSVFEQNVSGEGRRVQTWAART